MEYKESIFNFEIPFKGKTILYNTYSGALSLIDRPLNQYTKESERSELAKQGFIVDVRIDERNRLIVERNRELYTTRIRYLHIELPSSLLVLFRKCLHRKAHHVQRCNLGHYRVYQNADIKIPMRRIVPIVLWWRATSGN